MKAGLCVVLFVVLALAGCASNSDSSSTSEAGTAQASASGSATAPGSSTRAPATGASSSGTTGTTAATSNRPPLASLTATLNGTSATFALNGTDPDGDALTWSLSFGDSMVQNGTALPTSVTHTYASAGNYTAILEVADGKLASNTTFALHVLGAVTASAQPVTFTGHAILPDPTFLAEGECFWGILDSAGFPGSSDVSGNYHTLEADYTGWSFAFDVDGMAALFASGVDYRGDKAASGTVPADADSVFACSETAANTDYILTLTPPA
ncbi:MAG: PKD domain-containing protein [Candidatus Thermoplasmatota archaeon]